jgi:hypothetical protein
MSKYVNVLINHMILNLLKKHMIDLELIMPLWKLDS